VLTARVLVIISTRQAASPDHVDRQHVAFKASADVSGSPGVSSATP
jgi:hypothetical protein